MARGKYEDFMTFYENPYKNKGFSYIILELSPIREGI
jgi:hypothetical protein